MNFVQKINVNIIKTAIVKISDIMLIFFVARFMGPEPLGLISFGTAYISLFLVISNLGFDTAHVKKVSEGKDLGRCVGTYLSFKILICVLIILFVFSSFYIQSEFLNSDFSHPDQKKVIMLLLIPTILLQLVMVVSGTFEGQTKSASASLPYVLAPLVRLPFGISVAILGLGVYWLIYSKILRSLVLLFSFLYLFRNYPLKRPNLDYFKDYFSFAWKLFFYSMFTIISLQISRIILGSTHEVIDLGIYSTLHVLVSTLLILPASVKTLLFPVISKISRENQSSSRIISYVNRSERYISILILPLIITLGYFSEEVIHLFLGDNFISGSLTLSLLCIWVYLDSTKSPHGIQLMGTDRVGLNVIIGSFSIILHIFLNIILIPKSLYGYKLFGLGMEGAAISAIISALFLAISYRFVFFKIYGIGINRSLFVHFFAGIILLAIYINFSYIFDISSLSSIYLFLAFILISAFGATFFFLILATFNELTKEDYDFFRRSLDINETSKYATSEIYNN
ncbi:oligosaccharide flippase family protein [Marine Group III euryarchaeote]|nr:oligosaccharide flippase family protein [Marine Group III euryarchaeote]